MSEESVNIQNQQPVEYTDDNIRHLSDMEHVRTRPGMYIGRLGDGNLPEDGIYVLLKEVIDNSIDEFKMKAGSRIEVDIEDNLRLVIIDGYDVCACCAPCLKSSGEIQVVKILDYFVHRGGMRLTLVAGMDAVKDYAFLHTQNKEFMRLLSSKREDCASSLESKLIHCNEEHEEINNLKKEITKIYLKDIFSNPEYENKKYIVCFAPSFDEVMARNLINETVAKKECALTVCFDNKNDSFRFVTGKSDALDISLKNLATKIRNDLSGRGGGSDKMIQGSIPADEENIIKFFANLETD